MTVGFKKGNVPWNKGKKGLFHHTEEFKQKQRERMLGNNYTKNRIYGDPWNKGRTGVYSEETLEKMRQSMLGDTRWLGRKHSEETKMKMSEAGKRRTVSKETKVKLRQYKGEKASFYGRKHTDETKQKMRIARLNRTPFPTKDTKIERLLQEGLTKADIKYEKHINVCDICQPDIVFPEQKIAVFADGDYWHSKDFNGGKRWGQDRNQDAVLSQSGWTVLRFWGREIKADTNKCVNAIMKELN